MNELNIYQRINAVMKDCKYLQKTRVQQGRGVRYDEVIAMIRGPLIKHGIVMVVRQKYMQKISELDGTNQKIYEGGYEMDLVNMDKPEEVVMHSVSAHGMDGGDKAPGKTHTYAVKIMLTKGFLIETGEDEESRSEKLDRQNTINREQYDSLASYCLTQEEKGLTWTPLGKKLTKAYKITGLEQLPLSKYEEAIKRCQGAANESH